MTKNPTPVDARSLGIKGAVTSEELEERQLSIETAGRAQLHPGDVGDGTVSAIPINAFTTHMIQENEERRLLNDPTARVAIGSGDGGDVESALGSVYDSNDATAAIGGPMQTAPSPRRSSSPPSVASSGGLRTRRPARATKVTGGGPRETPKVEVELADDVDIRDQEETEESVPEVPRARAVRAPVNSNSATIEHLLHENHRLRAIIEVLEKKLGTRYSERDPNLSKEVLPFLADEDDPVNRLIQIVMVQTQAGKRSFFVAVNQDSIAVSQFRAEVDVDSGKFDFKMKMEKDLFDVPKKDS